MCIDPLPRLASAYDGPIPPAELAAARWGAGAWGRLVRGADAALIEARLRAAVAALARLRVSSSRMAAAAGLKILAGAVAQYRRAAVALLVPAK